MRDAALGFLALAIAAGSGAPVLAAANDPMTNYYGNTVLSTNQPLYQIRLWFYPNGTFKQFKASHETGYPFVAGWEGTFKVQGNPGALEVCMTYKQQPSGASMPAPTPGCRPMQPRVLGDVWQVTYSTGPYAGTIETNTLIEGHNSEP